MSTEAVVEYKQVSQEEVDASTVLALISAKQIYRKTIKEQ